MIGAATHRVPGRAGRIRALALVGLLAAGLLAWASSAEATDYSCMYVFGDSLSDTGNVWTYYNYTEPLPPYWQGRYSNGPLWVETLATRCGVANPTAIMQGGTNFAVAGSTTGNDFPNLQRQVQRYLESDLAPGGLADPTALYTVWSGGNDFWDVIGSNPTDAQLTQCAGSISTWVANVTNAVSTLRAAGAVNILVLDLPPLGSVPKESASTKKAEINALAYEFNTELADNMTAIENASPSLHLCYLDVYGLFEQVLEDPSAYGLVNVTDQAIQHTGDDPDTYLFWDTVHPTTAAHAILGNMAAQALGVPEPSGLALLACAAMAWLAVARRLRLGRKVA